MIRYTYKDYSLVMEQTALFALLTCLICLLYARRFSSRSAIACLRGDQCRPPNDYPLRDRIFGLDLVIKSRRLARKHQLIPGLARLYDLHGRTFCVSTLNSTIIHTIEPQNLQTAWVTQFKEWGVEQTRLPALGPFCGRGLVTLDGPDWAMSHAVVKPAFKRAVSVDLGVFETYLERAFERIPSGKSTVDVQKVFFDMVGSLRIDLIGASSQLSASILNTPMPF